MVNTERTSLQRRAAPEAIVLARADRLGDVVISTACIEPVAARFPHARLYFLAHPDYLALLEGHPRLAGTLPAGRSMVMGKALEEVRADWLVLLHPDEAVQQAGLFAKVPLRAGFAAYDPRTLTDSLPLGKKRGEKHEAEYCFDLLESLGVGRPAKAEPSVRLEEGCAQSLAEKFPASERSGPLAVFHLGAHAARDFPDEEFLHHQLRQLRKTPDFLERSHEVLSGGEAQIVAFLRVLFLDPDVLLLDEPTANLDPESAAAVEKVMRRWVAGPNRAILWSSHDPAQAERMRHGPRLELGGGP